MRTGELGFLVAIAGRPAARAGRRCPEPTQADVAIVGAG